MQLNYYPSLIKHSATSELRVDEHTSSIDGIRVLRDVSDFDVVIGRSHLCGNLRIIVQYVSVCGTE